MQFETFLEFDSYKITGSKLQEKICSLLKFIYSEKAKNIFEIFTFLLSVCTVDKYKLTILQNFVAFSEYITLMKFRKLLIRYV